MIRALEEYRVIGVRTNIPFHQHLLQNPDFLKGNFNTQFVQEKLPPLRSDYEDGSLSIIAALAATLAAQEHSQRSALDIQQTQSDRSNWKWISRWEQTRE
jgi:acetyl/propionyl-CoA carboxylase alpha subunit